MTDDAEPTPEPAAEDADHESAYELLQRGQDLLLQRHYAQAATVLERADRAEPGKGSILEALGRAYYNSGQHERSRAAFAELLELDPSAQYGHFALGQSLKRLGRTEEARIHLKLAVALSPDSAIYRGALARLGPAPDLGAPHGDPPDDPAEAPIQALPPRD
ncbi:MAG TPA: tetratricopeptide repeat protein [Patescibacteria group bacterium]|nr:tetratricopeptide repeat protein [Patescibacteria group bacterium]